MSLPVVPLRLLASTFLLVFALLLEGGVWAAGKADGQTELVAAAESIPQDIADDVVELTVGYVPGSSFMERGSALALWSAEVATFPHVNLAVLRVLASDRAFMLDTFAGDPDVLFVEAGNYSGLSPAARAAPTYGPPPAQRSLTWDILNRVWRTPAWR